MNLIIYIALTIVVGDYAKKALINPGIIYGCLSFALVFNSILAHYIFKQYLTIKTYLGIGVVILGVVWISVAKNSNYKVEEVNIDEDEIFKNRILAISAAILASFVSALRPI